MRALLSVKPILAGIVFAILGVSSATAWDSNQGSGTVGFGCMSVMESGLVKISYRIKPGREGASLRDGVQISIVKLDDLFVEPSYFKLRSEFMTASQVEERGSTGVLSANLDPANYLIIYGQWNGLSHDDPSDPYFELSVDGSAKLVTTWAGDVSIYNPSGRPFMPRQWGAIGKISAVWDKQCLQDFRILEAFPGAKVVTKIRNTSY